MQLYGVSRAENKGKNMHVASGLCFVNLPCSVHPMLSMDFRSLDDDFRRTFDRSDGRASLEAGQGPTIHTQLYTTIRFHHSQKPTLPPSLTLFAA